MPLTDSQGWMPVDAVVIEGRPGLSWLNMAGVDLAEPFFQQTVDRFKSEHPDAQEVFTEFDILVQLEKTFEFCSQNIRFYEFREFSLEKMLVVSPAWSGGSG